MVMSRDCYSNTENIEERTEQRTRRGEEDRRRTEKVGRGDIERERETPCQQMVTSRECYLNMRAEEKANRERRECERKTSRGKQGKEEKERE